MNYSISSLITSVDTTGYVVCLLIFVFILLLLVKCNWPFRLSLALVVTYVVWLFFSLVICRPQKMGILFQPSPFWALCIGLSGKSEYIIEILLNILMTVPIGLILSLIFVKVHVQLILIFVFESSIELLQLILKKGIFETADIICGIIGVLIGYSLIVIYRYIHGFVLNERKEKF